MAWIGAGFIDDDDEIIENNDKCFIPSISK